MHRSRQHLDFAPAPAADQARGVYETMLVVSGRPIAARRHLQRLGASLQALYGGALPAGLEAQINAAAVGHALARLRIDVVPCEAAQPAVGVALTALDPAFVLPADEVALATVGVSGCAGSHKLIDRSWLEQIEMLAGAQVRPLLRSGSGALLETTRANVLLLRDGVLATPPLDGSILPGTVRAKLLEHARRLGIEAHERPLTHDDLNQADVVLLSGSVRLLERAGGRGGRRSARAAERLADALCTEAFG